MLGFPVKLSGGHLAETVGDGGEVGLAKSQ
jgi:hypothetical protein